MLVFVIFLGWAAIFLLWRGTNLSPMIAGKLPKNRLFIILLILLSFFLWALFHGIQTFIFLILSILPAAFLASVIQNIYVHLKKKP